MASAPPPSPLPLFSPHCKVSADGSQICCANSDSGQCQIQSQFLSGTRYYDASNNRTRFEDAVNGVTVDDHNVLKVNWFISYVIMVNTRV